MDRASNQLSLAFAQTVRHSGHMPKSALGRGLGALLGGPPPGGGDPPAPAHSPALLENRGLVRQIPIAEIRPGRFQPRKEFQAEPLEELAESIRAQGIVQPLIVRKRGEHFELIAGERRWRAAQKAGLTEVPAIIRESNDAEALELALVENLQRADLNPLEEALGFELLLGQFQFTQEQVAAKVGKSRASVANALRLLKLPPEVQARLKAGEISVGHAKVLLSLPGVEEQKRLAQRIAAEGLNVRQTEQCAARLGKSRAPAPAGPAAQTRGPQVYAGAVEERLRQHLGTKVALRYHEGQGSIEIRFFSDADLNRVLELIGLPPD